MCEKIIDSVLKLKSEKKESMNIISNKIINNNEYNNLKVHNSDHDFAAVVPCVDPIIQSSKQMDENTDVKYSLSDHKVSNFNEYHEDHEGYLDDFDHEEEFDSKFYFIRMMYL